MARDEHEKKKGFFSKLKESLTRTRDSLSGRVDQLVAAYEELDDDFYEELTDILILADVGVKTSTMVVDRIKAEAREKKIGDPKQVRQMLKDILVDMMKDTDLRFPSPTVLMVIGVNGVGKTTTIGKLATRFQYIGRKVIICAGDTFRAAAADQLEVWAERAGTMIVRQHEGADPAAVLFDGIQASKARHADVLIVDTAGRLHNKAHLMEELKKMARVVGREWPEAEFRTLLVVDATTGQNGVEQARVFKDVAKLDGIILTKMD
ncbi:MAG: signal recognition particle-docking protein FtsY, partial [Candidatus Fimadaptatus sp.]